jgi:hypothetical protein
LLARAFNFLFRQTLQKAVEHLKISVIDKLDPQNIGLDLRVPIIISKQTP